MLEHTGLGMGLLLEESLCNIQIMRESSSFVVKIQTELGGIREYKSKNFEGVLQQMLTDIQEEFDGVP